ncbi:MAG TPA: MBL fold metallo-hydrolase, partial [Chloroflexota bacterium]
GISDIKKLTAQLTQLPIAVLNSHTHNDHVGGNWQFDSIYSMDTDFSRVNARGSSADARAEIASGEICGSLPASFDPKAYATRPWKITAYVHAGDKIDLGGRTLEVIGTPGHTPDSIALIDRANRLLFTGDTYYPSTIWIYRPETDLDAYQASLQKLVSLAPQVRLVLGAHNVPVAKPEVLNGLALAFKKVREGKVAPQKAAPGQVIYKVDGYAFRMKLR